MYLYPTPCLTAIYLVLSKGFVPERRQDTGFRISGLTAIYQGINSNLCLKGAGTYGSGFYGF